MFVTGTGNPFKLKVFSKNPVFNENLRKTYKERKTNIHTMKETIGDESYEVCPECKRGLFETDDKQSLWCKCGHSEPSRSEIKLEEMQINQFNDMVAE